MTKDQAEKIAQEIKERFNHVYIMQQKSKEENEHSWFLSVLEENPFPHSKPGFPLILTISMAHTWDILKKAITVLHLACINPEELERLQRITTSVDSLDNTEDEC